MFDTQQQSIVSFTVKNNANTNLRQKNIIQK